jgi:hypothetical protein
MNVHHLELFYYVARHGGIMEAVRNIPYGIQQPAVSGQIIQLEEFLGVTLFQRRPFSLTPQGKELYEFIKPFFENLTPMAEKTARRHGAAFADCGFGNYVAQLSAGDFGGVGKTFSETQSYVARRLLPGSDDVVAATGN